MKFTNGLLIQDEISLAIGETVAHISDVFMGCFPCDTRLEAFPPYLGRVSSLTRLFSLGSQPQRGLRRADTHRSRTYSGPIDLIDQVVGKTASYERSLRRTASWFNQNVRLDLTSGAVEPG